MHGPGAVHARPAAEGGTLPERPPVRIDGLWRDEDFVDWYPRDGRPGLSPAQLATVSVLQFLLGLSDRDAAEAVRCRLDFKYALGLDLDDPGFHHGVLTDFRDRLLEQGRADRLLDLALARLKEAGLVRERTTPRTDSTQVLATVRDLTRLELVTEAVRATLEELADIAVQDDPPPSGVYAVAHGHRTIFGCPHKPSMINAVAVCLPTPRPTPKPSDGGVLTQTQVVLLKRTLDDLERFRAHAM